MRAGARLERGDEARVPRRRSDGEQRVWDARYLPLVAAPGEPPDQLLLVATDVTEQRAAQEARLEAAIAQREMLVKEVHHRIKNNLQGVAGLLQQIAAAQARGRGGDRRGRRPGAGDRAGLRPAGRRRAGRCACVSVRRGDHRLGAAHLRPHDRAAASTAPTPPQWTLPEAESIPIALTINELLTNAVKHSAPASADEAIDCALRLRRRAACRSRSRNRGAAAGRLQPGAHSGRRLRPGPGARAAAAAQRERCRSSSTATDVRARRCRCVPPGVRAAPDRRSRIAAVRLTAERRWPDAAVSDTRARRRSKGKILVVDDDRLVLATLTHGLTQAGYDVDRRRQRRRRDPAGARAPARPGAARHPHGRQERLRRGRLPARRTADAVHVPVGVFRRRRRWRR